MDNKNIFANNLKKYMKLNGKTRRDICAALDLNYYTFSDWVNGKKYPRMDKVEILANYFGILKSDLIEEKVTEEVQKNNDIMTDIIVRMRTDEDFFTVAETLNNLDKDKLAGVLQMLQVFTK